ncbi:MAG: SdiA-regulated domain-containing protein [Bacteroidota bacterium]
MPSPTPTGTTTSSLESPFALDRPVAEIDLDASLNEISGLTLLDSMTLGAVQDERGRLYRLPLSTGQIASVSDFHGRGDFEGVERVGADVWALQSDGDLFLLDDDGEDARKYETPLSTAFDTEGLAYDVARHRLLVACKEYPGDGLDGFRAVYAFDLETETLQPRPALLLDLRADARLRTFKPSAIAFHPQTSWWLLLSSTTPMLAALDTASQYVGAWPLPEARLPQPEGLAVLPSGDLLIGSEGRPARIARFSYVPPTTRSPD